MRKDTHPPQIVGDEDQQKNKWVLKHHKRGREKDPVEDQWVLICSAEEDHSRIRRQGFVAILEQNPQRHFKQPQPATERTKVQQRYTQSQARNAQPQCRRLLEIKQAAHKRTDWRCKEIRDKGKDWARQKGQWYQDQGTLDQNRPTWKKRRPSVAWAQAAQIHLRA